MPTKGQILINPITGDTHEFLETAKDTHGERVTLKATIKSRGKLVPDHVHTLQEETYEVLSGQLTIWQDNKTTILSAGEQITLFKNKPHNHYNDSANPVVYKHITTPGLDFDYLMETLIGLAADGKSKNGKYGLMQELVILKYLDSKSFLSAIPIGVQKILMNTLAPIGKRLGYRAVYKKYSDLEK